MDVCHSPRIMENAIGRVKGGKPGQAVLSSAGPVPDCNCGKELQETEPAVFCSPYFCVAKPTSAPTMAPGMVISR